MNLMGRFFKYLSITVAALLGLLLIGVVVFALLFDPNDYRERIAAEVKAFSGRELKIEGDLGINFFPWLAIEVGRAELGNAAGFGPEPFASFDAARLNVRLMPLLLRREVLIGTAELNGLALNLAVDKSGRSNWQDLVDAAGDTGADETATEDAASPAALDIGGIRFDDASLVYEDAALGERYELREFDVATGAVQSGEPIGVKGSFSFASMPAAQSGDMTFSAVVSLPDAAGIVVLSELALEGSVNGLVEDVAATPVALRAPVIRLDTEAEVVDTGELGIEVFGLDIAAEVEPFSYAAELEPVAMLKIAPFAPRELMQALKIDAPVTADPKALGKLTIEGRASMTNERVAFSGLTLVLDDTTFTGELSAPLGEKGSYRMALAGDRIDLDRYMAPADDAASSDASADEAPIEIPVEIIKTIQAEGKLTLQSVLFAGLEFSDVTVGINNTNGKLRINPFTAAFFDGSYQGDIRIDATGAVAVVSANEKVGGGGPGDDRCRARARSTHALRLRDQGLPVRRAGRVAADQLLVAGRIGSTDNGCDLLLRRLRPERQSFLLTGGGGSDASGVSRDGARLTRCVVQRGRPSLPPAGGDHPVVSEARSHGVVRGPGRARPQLHEVVRPVECRRLDRARDSRGRPPVRADFPRCARHEG
jgi:AsmA protein